MDKLICLYLWCFSDRTVGKTFQSCLFSQLLKKRKLTYAGTFSRTSTHRILFQLDSSCFLTMPRNGEERSLRWELKCSNEKARLCISMVLCNAGPEWLTALKQGSALKLAHFPPLQASMSTSAKPSTELALKETHRRQQMWPQKAHLWRDYQ